MPGKKSDLLHGTGAMLLPKAPQPEPRPGLAIAGRIATGADLVPGAALSAAP